MKKRLFITGPVHDDVVEAASERYEVQLAYGPDAVPLADALPTMDAFLMRGDLLDRAAIARAPRLQIVARHGVGVNNVDVEAATEAGIWVTNTPGQNSTAVAEHAFALLLALARQVTQAVSAVTDGEWSTAKARLVGVELRGKTLGLIGFGDIARRVAPIAQGFGMHVIAYDPFVPPQVMGEHEVSAAQLEDLLAASDVVSLHLPLNEQTNGLLDARRLGLASDRGLYVVNTARGGLVDLDALLDGLDAGLVRGAALDVLPEEPPPASHPILTHERVVVTPHAAWYSQQAAADLRRLTAENVVTLHRTGRPRTAVNDPSGHQR